MTVVVYLREGCPYCKKVLEKVKNKRYSGKVEKYYCEKDFTTKEFKDKYGMSATFPRGYHVNKNGETVLLGGSDKIVEFLDKED